MTQLDESDISPVDEEFHSQMLIDEASTLDRRWGEFPPRGRPKPGRTLLAPPFATWTFDSKGNKLHCHAPCNILLYREGWWSFYSARIANNYKGTWKLEFRLQLLDRNDTVLYSADNQIAYLSKNEGPDDNGYDDYFTEVFDRNAIPHIRNAARSAVRRRWEPA